MSPFRVRCVVLAAFLCVECAIHTAFAQSITLVDNEHAAPKRVILKLRQGEYLLPGQLDAFSGSPMLAETLDRFGVASASPLHPVTALRKGDDELARFFILDAEEADMDALLTELNQLPGVEYAEADKLYRLHVVPNDSAWASQWGPQRIGMQSAWQVTRGDGNIVIGVIDTGIDFYHPDLRNQLWINEAEDANGDGLFQPWPTTEFRDGVSGDFNGIDNDGNGFIDDVIGYDFVDQRGIGNAAGGDYKDPDPIPEDEMGHGTSVSGIIAAQMNNGIGIAGIAPECKIMTLRAFDARGFGAESDVARALAYAVANGAHVINMSFGDVIYSRVLRDVIRYAYARGVVMVASAGNSQSPELHYPSAYDETISVSATTSNDALAGFSNYGQRIDIAAPGSNIVTTDKQGRYTAFYGTSASAPFVSAVAALVLSRNPELSPEEVRGILLASAEDLGATGWDERYGAGLLRADKAVRLDHPSVIRITSPRTDAASNANSLAIVGTVASPVMTAYQLTYGVGVNPSRWNDITPAIPRQVVDDTLAVWDISTLPDTTYTLRLAALSNRGATLDHRIIMHIKRTPPRIMGAALVPTLDGNAYGISVGFITDEPTLGKVWYRERGSTADWLWVSAEGDTRNNLFIAKTHSIFMGPEFFVSGRTYEFYLSAENAVGLESIARNQGGVNFEITLPPPVSDFGVVRTGPSLPVGRLLGQAVDLNGNGLPEILVNNFSENGRFEAWEFNGLDIRRVDNGVQGLEIPRGAGDVTGNGRPELLTSIVRNGFLYESTGPGLFPDRRIWGDSTGGNFWPITIADVTGDGRNEVLAIRNDSTVGVFTWDGAGLALVADIVNPTQPRPGNMFNAPKAAIGDFNGNGRINMLFGDDDGDFFIVEHDGSGRFPVIWGSENDFVQAGEFVAAGDFTGDGRDEFAIGFRTDTDDVVPFWFVGIFRLDENNVEERLWSMQFHGVTESSQFGSFTRIQNSLTAGNIDDDEADELIICTYPELYIIDYDPLSESFAPIWYHPLVNSNSTFIADIDGDGINEFAVALPDSIVCFKRDLPYFGPTIPRSLRVEYIDHSSARISWTTAGFAPEYRLYKGEDPASMQRIATFDAPASLTDPSLVSGTKVLYAITSFDSTRTPPESPKVFSRLLHPHDAPSVDSIRFAREGQLLVHVSQDMGTMLPSPVHFRLSDGRNPQSVALLDQRTLLLSFGTLDDGHYGLLISRLRDGEGIPFEDANHGPIEVRSPVINACFIERVDFVPPRSFDVLFSADVEALSAAIPGNYEFEPVGFASSARLDPENARLVRLEVAGDVPIGALGKEYVLSVRGVRCVNGAEIGDGPGSTAGIILNRSTLEDVFVYPNPLKPSDGQDFITFANLTPRAFIRIYTISGMFVREVEEKDGNGGVEWRLDDENGNTVPGGIYIFRASGTDADGKEVEAKIGKFAIIR